MAERIERDVIADLEIRDARADFDDFAGGFMTENGGQPRDHRARRRVPNRQMWRSEPQMPHAATLTEQLDSGRAWAPDVDHFGAECGPGFCDRFHLRNL